MPAEPESISPAPGAAAQSIFAWQWERYPGNHASRANLLIHLLSNPLFIAGGLTALFAPWSGHWGLALAGLLAMPLVMAAQGRGHKLESNAPAPFSSPLNAVQRIFAEQWFTFPRYVLTGGWSRAWRGAGRR